MSRHRSRIIALQAIVVGVLAVIVVVTLLKPEDSGLLSGVTTPGAHEPRLPSPGASIPRGGERGDRHGRDNRPAGPPGRATGGVVGSVTAPAPVIGAVPSTPTGAEPGDEGGEGSPTDDQYADTLSRITERLN